MVKREALNFSEISSKRSIVSHRSKVKDSCRTSANMEKYAKIPIQNIPPTKNHSKIRVQDLNYLRRKTVIEAFCGGEGY